MIIVKNQQKKFSISLAQYEKKIDQMLSFVGYANFDISVVFLSQNKMREINRNFRSQDKVTDVLSFPFLSIVPGKKLKIDDSIEQDLGDIFLCPAYIFENKKELPGDFNARMDYLLIHGLCHLLGYDHQTDADFKKMNRLEKKLITLLKKL